MQGREKIVDIIIVKYGLPYYEWQAVKQLMKVTKHPFHLAVYDNYPGDENLSTVWNRLIDKSNADYICLLNNDTVVSEGWLTELMRIFDNKKDYIGAVGPISNRAGGAQGGHIKPIPTAGKNGIVETHMLSGFCLLFPKEAWQKVGGFDERFKLYGEDNDFCRKLKKMGYHLYINYNVFIYHFGAKSTPKATARGKDILKIQKESAQLYHDKWCK